MKKTFSYLLAAVFVIAAPVSALAQQGPDLFITWQAQSYTPPGYLGRALPSVGTPMEAAFELVDSGKIIDVSKYEIRWLFGDRVYKTKVGLKSLSYVPQLTSGDIPLRITVVGYKGVNLEKEITIPLARPEVVITAPYQNREIKTGKNVFRALPYFFNAQSPSDIRFEWAVDKKTADAGGERPDYLELETPEEARGLQVALSVFAQNFKEPLEFASSLITLFVR